MVGTASGPYYNNGDPKQPSDWNHVSTSQTGDRLLQFEGIASNPAGIDGGGGGGPAEDDHGNSRGQATDLGPNASASGNLERGGDVDYFRVRVASAGTLRVETTGSTDTYGYLQNAGGGLLERDDDSGAGANFRISRRVSAGTHYVAVVGGPGRAATGAYRLSASFSDDGGGGGGPPSDDHGNSRDRATDLGPNASASGNLERGGDVDYFRVRVASAGTLRVETTGSTDTYGYLQNAGGGLLERDDDSGAGSNFRISRRVSAGTHYVAVVGGPERAATGAYRLSASFSAGGGGPPSDDHGNSRDRATDLGPNASASGNLERGGDVDYFRVRVASAGTLRVETTGSTDTYGYLQNAGGGLLARDDDSGAGANFRISRRVSAGTHYVAVVGGPERAATGAYRLSASFSADGGGGGGPAEDDHGNSRGQATALAPNAAARGSLERRGDVDYFRIRVAEAGTLRVRTTGSTDTFGYLQNAGGAQLGRDDDSGEGANFQISRRVSAGIHYVAVVGGPERAATGAYCLIAQFGDEAPELGCGGPGPGGMQPGSKFRDCPECPEMVVVPAGSFMMGSPPHEQGRGEDEGPVREVRIGAPFAAGVYELTFDEWDACVADGGCGGHRPGDEGWGRGRRPAINISWRDAQLYVEWLSGRTGESYRLLSEAEWEYAARAGTATPFHTGSGIATDQANHGSFQGKTVPAGSFEANAFGLHDMHGNVWEWVQDCWNDSYAGAPGDGGARESGDCSSRVLRGGFWGSASVHLRSANRYRFAAAGRDDSKGFRVARSLAVAGGGPAAGAAIPDQPSLVAGRDATIDLSRHFTDDQTLSYEARSSDAEVVRVSVTGSVLTLMPVSEGRATVTVTARDPDGNAATQTFEVTVGGGGGPGPDPGPGPGSGGRAGEKFRDCDACPEMVVVPAGTFMMGAPESEVDSISRERPVHSVSVPSFAMGVHEVTFDEWDACVAEGGCGGYRLRDDGWGRGDRPVFRMSWDDAQRYVEWLSGKTGRAYRLPSESEWEYAARAGTRTPFHTGGTITPQQANYDGRVSYPSGDYDPNGLHREQTLPVGSFPANAFGLHDVHGNVREWVQDCWNDSYAGAPGDGGAWESGNCYFRVLRGGSWFDSPWHLRSAFRDGHRPSANRNRNYGFRVARTL